MHMCTKCKTLFPSPNPKLSVTGSVKCPKCTSIETVQIPNMVDIQIEMMIAITQKLSAIENIITRWLTSGNPRN